MCGYFLKVIVNLNYNQGVVSKKFPYMGYIQLYVNTKQYLTNLENNNNFFFFFLFYSTVFYYIFSLFVSPYTVFCVFLVFVCFCFDSVVVLNNHSHPLLLFIFVFYPCYPNLVNLFLILYQNSFFFFFTLTK